MSHHTPELARRRVGHTTNGAASSNQGWSGVDVAELPDLGTESHSTGLNDSDNPMHENRTTAEPSLNASGESAEESGTAGAAGEEGNEDANEVLESVRQATTFLQNVVPFVLLLLSKLLQDYATTLLFMAVLLHGRLELDRRFTNQVALGSGVHKGQVLYIAWSALGGGLALAFFLDYANTGRRLLLLPTTLGHSTAPESMESEVAMLSPHTEEIAAAAAEAGAAAVGAAQASAAARGAEDFGRIDDWIVPASDALRLTWVLGTALRVDLVAQLLTVGAKALLWLVWPLLFPSSTSPSSSNPTLWSTVMHVGRCRLFWLLGAARRLGQSARRLGNWLGCNSVLNQQSNSSLDDDDDDRRHFRSTGGLFGPCLDSIRSISSGSSSTGEIGSVGSILRGTWQWLRLMVSRLWSHGASWLRRGRRRAQFRFTEFMANIPLGNEPLPTTALRSQRSNSSNGSASNGGGGVVSATLTTGSSEANAEFQAPGMLRDGDLGGGGSGGDDTTAATATAAAAAAPSPSSPHPTSPSPRGPSQYLVYRRRRQLLAMVEALSLAWRLLLPVPLWCRYYAGTMPSIAPPPPPSSLDPLSSSPAASLPEGAAWNEVQASQFAHVLVGVYLTLKTLVLLAHLQSMWAAMKAIWKEARQSSSSSSFSPLLSCASSMRVCINVGTSMTRGWASALPCAVGTAAITAARDSFHQSQISVTTPNTNTISRSGSGGNLSGHDSSSTTDNGSLVSRCIRAASVGVEAGSNVWSARMDSFLTSSNTGMHNINNNGRSSVSLPQGQEEVIMHGRSPFDSPPYPSSSSFTTANGEGASLGGRGAADVTTAADTATATSFDGSKVSMSRCGRLASEMDVLEAGKPDCPICFEPLCRPLALSPCGHLFCEDCAWEWLDREKTCPLCRAAVERSDDDPIARAAFATFNVTTGATNWTFYIM